MDKFRNIFWHEGAKLYDEKDIEKDKKILKKVEHLENDVTKSLLNVLENNEKKFSRGK